MEDFVETFCLKSTESSQFGFVEPCCVQTIQQFREYASFKNLELVCLRENSVVPDTAQCFKFRPCSAKASIQLRPNTAIVTQETSQIKQRLFRNHIISIVFFFDACFTSHWKHFQFGKKTCMFLVLLECCKGPVQ